ncbi:MAG: TRAP transporter small permease [Pseudomonadota bacterium]|nr:C4-dicarboxylate ABC transporter permease [Gammaproteobacteria bacterium]MEE2683679.1 TRAP transporter small permease [Pseudomonadota bacterium]|tara:strand:- start:4302 stop:4829 length:528 start_codon:yes stop_codon:yes gene_type:complete
MSKNISKKSSYALDKLEEIFMATALAFMTILTFVQVILRAFGTGWVWSLEATTYAFAWLVLVGMAYGVRTNSHIAVDLVSNMLPPFPKKIMAMVAIFICLLYSALMFYGGFIFVDRLIDLGNNARDIPIPRWVLTSMLPIGFSLLTYRFIQLGIKILNGGQTSLGHTTHKSNKDN